MNEVEQHQAAFGEHTGLSTGCRFIINGIKRNYIGVDRLILKELIETPSLELSDLAWKLLGRYIANNTCLKTFSLRSCGISDEKMALLFSELTSSSSISEFDVTINEFGIEGLRSMIPFMSYSPQLINLGVGGNNNINTECFELLTRALHGRLVEKLYLFDCNITNISALDIYNLPHLQLLHLSDNNIGREGCLTISNLLQQEGSNLKQLYLASIGMGDEGAELLATSLKHNTKLETLSIPKNNITKRGKGAFLKLLVDASSIENTYNSNHTLMTLLFELYITRNDETDRHIRTAIQINESSRNSHLAGREKIIKYQLNNQNRKELCHLKGIEYTSIANPFADIEPLLFPNILALIGIEHGQSEFYQALIPMAPDLMSYIDRRALISRDIAAVEDSCRTN